MSRRRSASKTGRPAKAAPTAPVAATAAPPHIVPADYRMGVGLFLLLELVVYATLALTEQTHLGRPEAAVWRNATLTVSVIIVVIGVGLWVMGARRVRFGRTVLLCVVWLILLTGRLVPLFVVAGSALPTVLTVYVGQLGVGLIVPASARERRRGAVAKG